MFCYCFGCHYLQIHCCYCVLDLYFVTALFFASFLLQSYTLVCSHALFGIVFSIILLVLVLSFCLGFIFPIFSISLATTRKINTSISATTLFLSNYTLYHNIKLTHHTTSTPNLPPSQLPLTLHLHLHHNMKYQSSRICSNISLRIVYRFDSKILIMFIS